VENPGKKLGFGGLDDIGWVEVRFGVVGVMSNESGDSN